MAAAYGFTDVIDMGYPTSTLDQVPQLEMVAAFWKILKQSAPQWIYLPFVHDAHGDHQRAFAAAHGCIKTFRHPSVRRVLMMETVSETNFGMNGMDGVFAPNVFVDVTSHLDRKIEIMNMYAGEMAPHPFPRSEASLKALATLRGSMAGCRAAEAFMLVKEVI